MSSWYLFLSHANSLSHCLLSPLSRSFSFTLYLSFHFALEPSDQLTLGHNHHLSSYNFHCTLYHRKIILHFLTTTLDSEKEIYIFNLLTAVDLNKCLQKIKSTSSAFPSILYFCMYVCTRSYFTTRDNMSDHIRRIPLFFNKFKYFIAIEKSSNLPFVQMPS